MGNIVKKSLFLALAFPLLAHIIITLSRIIGRFDASVPAHLLGVAAVVLFTLALAYSIRIVIRKKILSGMSEKMFLILAISVAFAVSLASILLIDIPPGGDFYQYHLNALDIYEGKYSTSYLFSNLDDLYLRRSLVNLAPLYLVFGPDLFLVQLFNALVNIATGLLLYYFVRLTMNNLLVARLTLVFYFMLPITYLTLNVPSHDIPGLFYLMAALVIFAWIYRTVKTGRKWILSVLLSLFLGILLFILQLSRSLGTFCFYALLILMIFSLAEFIPRLRHRNEYLPFLRKILVLFILPLSTYYLLALFLLTGNINKGRFIMMFIATDTSKECQGAYWEIADYKTYYKLVPPEDRDEMAIGKFRSELFYNYPDFLKLQVKKSSRLYSLGVDKSWAKGEENSEVIKKLSGGAWLVSLFLYFFAVMSIFYFSRKYRLTGPLSFLFFLMIILTFLLVLIGEVSPRYAYLFIPGITIMAAVGFLTLPMSWSRFLKGMKDRPGLVLRDLAGWIVLIGLVVVLLAGIKFWLNSTYSDDELVYKDLSGPEIAMPGNPGGLPDMISGSLTPQERPLKFGLQLPPGADSVSVAWRFDAEPGASYRVRGFLREKADRGDGLVTALSVNGLDIEAQRAGNTRKSVLRKKKNYTVRYFTARIPAGTDGQVLVKLALRRQNGAMNVEDLTDDSATFLEFLQIVKTPPHETERADNTE